MKNEGFPGPKNTAENPPVVADQKTAPALTARWSKRLPYMLAVTELQSLIQRCRRDWADFELQFVISYPESASQGGFMIRPYSRGGPGAFVDISMPVEHKEKLEELYLVLTREG